MRTFPTRSSAASARLVAQACHGGRRVPFPTYARFLNSPVHRIWFSHNRGWAYRPGQFMTNCGGHR